MSYDNSSCPRCSTRRIVLGEVARGHTIGRAEPFSFRAFASRFSALRKGAKIAPNFAACTKCGLVWGQVSTNALHDHLETLPTGEMKQWLKSAHDTPI